MTISRLSLTEKSIEIVPWGNFNMSKNSVDISAELDAVDALITQAKFKEAREALELIKIQRNSGEKYSVYVRLHLRLGNFEQVYNLLKHYFNESSFESEATISEYDIVSFAMALRGLGAIDLAHTVFDKVDSPMTPEYFLFRGITHFSEWKYVEAIPLIQKYLQFQQLTPYQRVLGGLNLVAGLVFVDRFAEAAVEIDRILESCAKNGFNLLLANALELKACLLTSEKKYVEAQKVAEMGLRMIGNDNSNYSLFLNKWITISELYLTQTPEPKLRKLNEIREKAISLSHWETVRDCDYHFCIYKKDKYLFRMLMAGTPYGPFRERLRKDFGSIETMDKTFDWYGQLPPRLWTTKVEPQIVDFSKKEITIGKEKYLQNSLTYKLLRLLSEDFYKPMRSFYLYTKLFRGEKLNPFIAKNKIFSLVSRVRKEFEEQNFNLDIEGTDLGYKLVWKSPLIVRVEIKSAELSPVDNYSDYLNSLNEFFKESTFDVSYACEILKLPKRTVQRILAEMSERNLLERSGVGRATRYKIVR